MSDAGYRAAKAMLALICLRLVIDPFNEYGNAPFVLKKLVQAVNLGLIATSLWVLWSAEASRRTFLKACLWAFIPFSAYQLSLTLLELGSLFALGTATFAILKVITGPLLALASWCALERGYYDGRTVLRTLVRTLNWLMVANLAAIYLFPGLTYREMGYNVLEFEKLLGLFPVKENYASFLIFGVALNLYLSVRARKVEFALFILLHLYLLGILNSRSQAVGLLLFFGVVGILSLSLRFLFQAGALVGLGVFFLREWWLTLPLVITLNKVFEAFSQVNPITVVLNARADDIYYILSSGRTMIWRNAIDNFIASPPINRAFGNTLYITSNELLPDHFRTNAAISYYIDPHSDVLFVLHQFGLAGLVACLILFVYVSGLFLSRRATLEGKYCCGILAMVTSSSLITNGIMSRFIPQVLALVVLVSLGSIHRSDAALHARRGGPAGNGTL